SCGGDVERSRAVDVLVRDLVERPAVERLRRVHGRPATNVDGAAVEAVVAEDGDIHRARRRPVGADPRVDRASQCKRARRERQRGDRRDDRQLDGAHHRRGTSFGSKRSTRRSAAIAARRLLFFNVWCFAFLACTFCAVNGSSTRLFDVAPGWNRPLPVLVTEIATVLLVAAPALSVTVTVIVKLPTFGYGWLAVHVPAPFDSPTVPFEVVPSPQVTLHVCVSLVPASVNEALSETVEPDLKRLFAVGLVIDTDGAAFATVTEKLPVEELLLASATLTVTV